MSKYTNSMFSSIKDALTKQSKQSSGGHDFLRFEAGNTYVLRLLPNLKAPEKSWFRYYTFGFKSFATGKYISEVSPTSWNERDPIAEERIRIYRNGTEAEKEKIKEVRRSERWLMQAYVVSNPVNPEDNGKEKKIRIGKQLFNIINNAIIGEDSDEYGEKVFDLTAAGVNLKVKVDDQGGFANYTASRFTSPVDLKLTDAQITAIHDRASNADLERTLTVKSYDELRKLFDEHYHCKLPGSPARTEQSTAEQTSSFSAPVDDSPFIDSTDDEDEDDDVKMRRLLDGM